MSLLLVSAAGLLMRSFFHEREIDLGIRTDHLLVTHVNLPAKQYKSSDSQARFLRELLPRIERLPGVVSVAGSLNSPPQGAVTTAFEIAGMVHASLWRGYVAPSSHAYFRTLGLRLVAGRLLTAGDENGKRQVAVINQAMAGHYFGGHSALGRQLKFDALTDAPNSFFEVVGVVSDSKNNGPRQETAPEAYIPYTTGAFGGYNLFVHTIGAPNGLASALAKQVLALDRNVIPQQTLSMDELLEISQYARPRFGLILFSVFAGVGLLLASVGVYSVISYSVTQRHQEIGIRMALGASAADARLLVVGNGMRVMFLGMGMGMILVALTARVLASQLWGVSWYDPATLTGVVRLLTAVGLAACYIPSMRAVRTDPASCLRFK